MAEGIRVSLSARNDVEYVYYGDKPILVYRLSVCECFDALKTFEIDFLTARARDKYIERNGYEPIDSDAYSGRVWARRLDSDVVFTTRCNYDIVYCV